MKGKSSTVMEKSEKKEEEGNHPDVDVKSESSLRRLTLGRACSLTPSTSLQSEQSDPQLTSITMLVCKLNILLTKFVCSKTSHGFKWGQFYPSPKVFYTNAIRDKLQVLQALVRSPFRSSFPKLPAMSWSSMANPSLATTFSCMKGARFHIYCWRSDFVILYSFLQQLLSSCISIQPDEWKNCTEKYFSSRSVNYSIRSKCIETWDAQSVTVQKK